MSEQLFTINIACGNANCFNTGLTMNNAVAFETINVLAVFAGMRSRDYVHRVNPLRFRRACGELHRIARIRRVYRDQKGARVYVHFVVQTEEERYFDLVFDPHLSLWKLVLEIDRTVMIERESVAGDA